MCKCDLDRILRRPTTISQTVPRQCMPNKIYTKFIYDDILMTEVAITGNHKMIQAAVLEVKGNFYLKNKKWWRTLINISMKSSLRCLTANSPEWSHFLNKKLLLCLWSIIFQHLHYNSAVGHSRYKLFCIGLYDLQSNA